MGKREKNRWMGVLLGPALSFFAVVALWKNETRFDYYRAAAKTDEIQSADEGADGQLISLTGPMDQSMSLDGEYVESFTGFLEVWRIAQIYAWDKDKSSDDRVTWNLEWMSSVESNSRNSGVHQRLSSNRFLPPKFDVGSLPVASSNIEFVDSSTSISPSQLKVTHKKLQPESEYLYLRKGKPQQLGDERVSYSGIPIPSQATYFGKLQSAGGVADLSHKRDGMINRLIQDTGVLHHIVAGDRAIALATMKSHIARVKWIVRGLGTLFVVVGFLILFSTIVGFLFHIPILGRVAETGVFVLSLAIGLPIAFVTILSSYLFAHPLILLLIVGVIGGLIYYGRRRGKSSQQAIRSQLDAQYGRSLGANDIKELEFLELAQLAMSDSSYGAKEERFLQQWASKHGWDSEKFDQMLQRAKHETDSGGTAVSNDEHLMNVMRLSLADGSLSQFEIRAIRTTAQKLGYDNTKIRQMLDRARQSAAAPAV